MGGSYKGIHLTDQGDEPICRSFVTSRWVTSSRVLLSPVLDFLTSGFFDSGRHISIQFLMRCGNGAAGCQTYILYLFFTDRDNCVYV